MHASRRTSKILSLALTLGILLSIHSAALACTSILKLNEKEMEVITQSGNPRTVALQLADMGVRVIAAGLDMDFRGVPFGPMPGLMACAEYVTKVHAVCMRCGHLAQYSHRLSEAEKLVLLGEKESYEPLCRECYQTTRR